MKNFCLYCGKTINNAGNKIWCDSKCRYAGYKLLALSGELEPTRYNYCKICKKKYPYYAVLQNKNTCSLTNGGKCTDKIKSLSTLKQWKAPTKEKKRPKICLTYPRCVNYLTAIENGFLCYTGDCYKKPSMSEDTNHTGLIHSFV